MFREYIEIGTRQIQELFDDGTTQWDGITINVERQGYPTLKEDVLTINRKHLFELIMFKKIVYDYYITDSRYFGKLIVVDDD